MVDIKNIMKKYSIDTTNILQEKGRGNLLVADPQIYDGQIFARLMDVPWGGIEQFGDWRWAPEQITGYKVSFNCDEYVARQVLQSTRVLLFDFELERTDTIQKIFQLKTSQQSFITTWYNGTTAAHWTLNLCCGGYGGWEYAFKTAYEFGWPYHFHIGIDHSLSAAAQHSINHRTQLIPNMQLQPSFIADRHKSTTICASIQAQGWRQAVSMINPQIWTFSFPCQSWTGAAWSQGFQDDNGKILLEGMGMARIMRPALILLENVKNFPLHQQYSDFCQVVQWCGYRFLHQAVVDAQERTPCVRPRWLAVLERIEEIAQPFNWPKWEVKHHNLMTWGCHLKSSDEIDEFRLTPQVVKKYMDVAYLPLHAPYWAKNNLLNYRAVPLQNKLPVVMAAYGRQHDLSDDLLRSRGLFGHFTAEECKFRWWKPIELMMAHMQIDPIALLKPKESAWQIIGNSIIQHHALMAVYAAFDHLYGPNKDSFESILTLMESKRMTPEIIEVHSDEFAWYAGPKEKIEPIQSYVKILSKELAWRTNEKITWPINCIFDFELGCISMDHQQNFDAYQAISPTMPFSLQEQEAIEELPREENSPLESPADQIPDTLDYRIKKHFEAIEIEKFPEEIADQEVSHDCFETPLQQDDYQILSDESMKSESDLDCTDDVLQSNLQEYLVPMEIEKTEVVHMVTPLLQPGNYSAMCILDDLQAVDLTQLWQHHVALIDASRYCQVTEGQLPYCAPNEPIRTGCLMPVDQSSWYLQNARECQQDTKLLLFDIAGQTFAQKMKDQAIPHIKKFPTHEQKEVWYDEVGETSNILPESNIRVFQEMVEIGKCFDIQEHIKAMNSVKFETRIPPDSDVLVLQFRGQPEELAKVLTFWHMAIDSNWMEKHARALIRQIVDPTCVQLIFQPRGNIFATPISIFRYALETKLLMTMLNSFQQSDHDRKVHFKVSSRNLPPFHIPKDIPWETLLIAIRHIYAINEHGLQPSIIHAGKKICDGHVGDFDQENTSSHVKFHIIRPIIGGTGAKVEHKQAIHAGLSSLFMDHGVSFKQVPDNITTMIQQYGLPRMTVLLFGEDASNKEAIFRELCQQCSIQLPIKSGNMAQAKAKFQKLGAEKNAHEMRNLDVTKYQLKPGYFLTSQGKPLPITAEFSPCVPSITMMTADSAKQWVAQQGKLLPDELAIFIVGELDIPNIPIKQLVAPAINSDGQQCLIAGYLLQLGDKQVTIATDEGVMIQTHDVQICSFTMWKQDFSNEEWQEATKAPVRFAKQLLAKDALDETIRSPFGRAFRKDSKPCNPAEATSIQYHSEVKLADLRKLLRRSGFNRLFVTPKTANGKPSDQWRVIWLPQTIQQLEAMCLGQSCTAGLIRGKKSQGIRVESNHFQELWEKFHPGVAPPRKNPQGDVFKIQPLPFGVDRDVLQEWADNNTWEMNPIRPLGAKTWLVNALLPPPREVMFFNSNPLLITKITPKATENPTGLVAGPRSAASSLTVPPVKNPTIFKTGDPFLDPWQTASIPPASKVESGPTEQYLQQHDQQIKHLEQAVQDLQTMAKDAAKKQDEKFQKVETQMQNQANHTQAVLQSFESSLAQAMSQQESRISSSMDELKQLLLRKEKRTRASSDDISED